MSAGSYDTVLSSLLPCILYFSDIDECSTSVRVCDANAICENTLGSYLCSCKAGYNGAGKTCTGGFCMIWLNWSENWKQRRQQKKATITAK